VLCISIASLLTASQSEKSMHALVEQNTRLVEAQSTPLLMLDSGNFEDGKRMLRMTVSNVGTGPAQVVSFHIADAQGVNYSGGALYGRMIKLQPDTEVSSEQISGSFLRAGDKRTVFAWPRPVHNPAAEAAWDKLDKDRFDLHASACYCSIFDECRVTEFGDTRPKVVSSCEAAKPNR
jgi:hypothetical protein